LWKELGSGRLCLCPEGQRLPVASDIVEEAIPKTVSSALSQSKKRPEVTAMTITIIPKNSENLYGMLIAKEQELRPKGAFYRVPS
jgi:hypothetical protein